MAFYLCVVYVIWDAIIIYIWVQYTDVLLLNECNMNNWKLNTNYCCVFVVAQVCPACVGGAVAAVKQARNEEW